MSDSLAPVLSARASASEAPRRAVRPDPLYHGVLLGLSTAILMLALVLSIRSRSQVLLPWIQLPLPELCMMRRLTGIGCPGCGMTRCFISLAHGDFVGAWSYNPAGLFLFVIVAMQIPFRGAQLWRIRRGRPEWQTGALGPIVIGGFALALIGQWLLRLTGISL